jgi:hypothetical protein
MTIDPQVHRRLLAASGFAELSLFQEAVRELEELPESSRELPTVLMVWLEVYQHWQKFPNCGTIQFNLACYAAQLGQLDEARRRLGRAIHLDKGFAIMAKTDPDLEAIRNEID